VPIRYDTIRYERKLSSVSLPTSLKTPEVVLVVNMAAKHRFPGSRVCKIGRCRICTHYLEADKLEFGADVAARVDYCARHYDDFRQLVGDSDSDKVNILSVPVSKPVA